MDISVRSEIGAEISLPRIWFLKLHLNRLSNYMSNQIHILKNSIIVQIMLSSVESRTHQGSAPPIQYQSQLLAEGP